MQPTIIAVILSMNRREDTLECLRSLHNNTYPNLRAIVLDIASSDGSVPAIRESFPAVRVIELKENRGYAGNNNIGITEALSLGADWILLLNEDTILDRECVAEILRGGMSDERIGIVGPLIYHHDEPRIIQSAGGRFGRDGSAWHLGQNTVDIGQFSALRDVDWVSGCAIALRRAVIEQVGLLDERFFCYWEEAEWCIRAGKGAWRIVHAPSAKLWHKGVQRRYRPNPSVTYYSTRNHLLMLSKHHMPLSGRLVTWAQIVRTLATWTIRPKWRGKRAHRDAMWQGAVDFLRQRWGPRPS